MARNRGLYRRKNSRYWWVNLRLPNGRRVCKSTGCTGRADAEAFVVGLKGGLLDGGEHRQPRSFAWPLNLAHQDWRWIRAVPKIRMLREPRRRVRFLRREEAGRLLEALPTHMKPIVRFALATGCRAGEIFGLEWDRVDLARKVAWLDHGATKSGEGRGIPLNADAVAALQSTCGQHPRWCFTFAARRIQKSSTAWDKARRRAGVEDFRFHDLRHLGELACAKRYFVAGTDGTWRLEVLRDGSALCPLGPGKTELGGKPDRVAFAAI